MLKLRDCIPYLLDRCDLVVFLLILQPSKGIILQHRVCFFQESVIFIQPNEKFNPSIKRKIFEINMFLNSKKYMNAESV
jgi:hypothetical protein